MKRIIELSRYGMSLMIREGCLQISENEILRSTLPLREISVVLIANPAVSLSGYVLAELAEQHIPLICCSASFLPVAFLNPLTGKAEREPVFQALFQASEPFKKQIWQALIRSKIAGQAFLLKTLKNSDVLFPLIKKVRSGDTGNTEAYAAAIYWKKINLVSRRDHSAQDNNILFNYGYTILSAMMARECAAAGFYPKFGIKHHHRDNPYCLASDLMEPFRPCIDSVIASLPEQMMQSATLSRAIKNRILQGICSIKIPMDGNMLSLPFAVRKLVFSFRKALLNKKCDLMILPDWKKWKCGPL